MPKTVLAISAHPDDAEFAAAGLLAKYARDGHKVLIAIATDGSLGGKTQVGPALAARRKGEARRAAAVLGAAEPIFLGLPDFGLDRIPPAELRERFIRLIREIRPDILVLQDPSVFDPHPDHRALALATADAAAFSGLPSIYPKRDKSDPEPWYVPERLFYSDPPVSADYLVDISNEIGLKVDAILAHESQLEFLVDDITQQAKAAGIEKEELASVLGEGAAGPEGPASLMAMAVQKSASEIGARSGFAFGEAFRRLRFHPYIETLIAANSRSASGGDR